MHHKMQGAYGALQMVPIYIITDNKTISRKPKTFFYIQLSYVHRRTSKELHELMYINILLVYYELMHD